MLPAAFINPGDVTLMTVPGYPVAGTHTKYYGGEVHRLPLLAENDFLPDLDSIPADIRRRAKLLVINYPNSPTGKAATREFYAQVIDFARTQQRRGRPGRRPRHVQLRRRRRLSFLQVPGAREVGVEVHSLSKGWNMIGWRMGWVCGHERIVRALADVKDNCDSGQFIAIQKAAAAALDDPEIPRRTRAKYRRRLEKLVAALGRCGFDCRMPGGSYFLYTPQPQGHGRRAAVSHGRSLQPIPDRRALDLHGALGRRRGVSAVLGHLRSGRRGGRRRPDGRDRAAAEADSSATDRAGVLKPYSPRPLGEGQGV